VAGLRNGNQRTNTGSFPPQWKRQIGIHPCRGGAEWKEQR
jgi:hypothetical protein